MIKKITAYLLIAAVLVTSAGFYHDNALAKGDIQKKPAAETGIYYSNLKDEKSVKKLKTLFKKSEIPESRQKVFMAHLNQFNKAIPSRMLVNKMTEYRPGKTLYDPYDMQDRWDRKYPDYLGQNCRLTAFTLFGGNISVKNRKIKRDSFILFDKSAASSDPWVKKNKIKKKSWLKNFSYVYSSVPSEPTIKTEVHVKNLQKDWKKRGIVFKKNKNASLISVVLHDNIDGDNLFIGHTGILFRDGKELWFLEKTAFQEPYCLTKFRNRSQLNNYLMKKYDTDINQPTAPPFIMENDRIMTGYKPVR